MDKILIVEDEKLIRQGIITMVKRSGVAVAEVFEAANGEAALELIRAHTFDVVFTDIRMPKMDGIQLVKEIRKLPHPPITIAISGYDEFSYAVEMLRLGVREYILKPVEREAITRLLNQLEEEIRKRSETEQDNRNIGFQQLKYMMINENITAAETEAVEKQYGKSFYAQDYLVCCTNNTGNTIARGRQHIYLGDVEFHELYIIEGNDALDLWEESLQERYVGVSARHRGLKELKPAYREAAAARRKAFWTDKKMVIYKPEEESDGSLFPENEIRQLVRQFGTDKEEGARRQISELFYHGRRGHYDVAVMEKSISLLLVLLRENYGKIVTVTPEAEPMFESVYLCESAGELEGVLNRWLDGLGEKLKKDFDDYRNRQKIRQAILYINENYRTDLNMAVVSNLISMNYSLFSHIFKLHTGSRFVDYIKELRIKEACRLLETTELRVNEISRKVGYENEKHFMKMFKGICGVSPTEYRKNSYCSQRWGTD